MKNEGFKKEIEFVEALNGKTYDELNQNLKNIVKEIMGGKELSNKVVICAKKCFVHAKPDIQIIINGISFNISVKTGNSKSIHSEGIKSFILFLRELGVSSDTQKILLFYHYGDGTLTGKGKKRYTKKELINLMDPLIKKANIELDDKKIIKETAERFLLTGGHEKETGRVDFIMFGTIDCSEIISAKDLIEFAVRKNYSKIRVPHIGPIIIKPYLRDPYYKSKNESKREVIHGDWPHLKEDIMKIKKAKEFSNDSLAKKKGS